jgi:TadE-like protein
VSRAFAAQRGAALMEFALAWPIALVLVLGAVQTAVWGSETFAANSAALAGARAGAVAGADPAVAVGVTLRALSPSLIGVAASAWCPDESRPLPPVWVCARDLGGAIEVEVGGDVPSLVPIVNQGRLPLHAHVVVQKEVFTK